MASWQYLTIFYSEKRKTLSRLSLFHVIVKVSCPAMLHLHLPALLERNMRWPLSLTRQFSSFLGNPIISAVHLLILHAMDLFFQAIRLMVMFLIPAWMTMVTESSPLIFQWASLSRWLVGRWQCRVQTKRMTSPGSVTGWSSQSSIWQNTSSTCSIFYHFTTFSKSASLSGVFFLIL